MHFKSNIDFIDGLISETIDGVTGIPTGIWIQLVGPPGSGKTTLAAQMLLGFAKNDICTIHYDYEMRRTGAMRLYNSLGADLNSLDWYHECTDEPALDYAYKYSSLDPAEPLVVLIDSFGALGGKTAQQIKLATQVKDSWKEHPNLILITVNHTNKRGQIAGAAQVQQLSDVVLNIRKDSNGFTYLTSPKNRVLAPGAPDVIKLQRLQDQGFTISNEPDFISDIPIVSWVRQMIRKKS